MLKLPLKWMPAAAFGGLFKAPAASCVVVHCTESENNPGMAEALAGPGWFGGTKAGTSSHKVVDVDSICEGVQRSRVAFHAGPGGNSWGIAYEFCGRASWSAAKWREPAQLQMLRNAAPHIADDLVAITGSIKAAITFARWLSLAQLAAHQHGLCTHNDVRLAFGGTTHTDPGPNFPYTELLAYVRAELGDTSGGAAGAAGSPDQEDDMYDAAAEARLLAHIDDRFDQVEASTRQYQVYQSDPSQGGDGGMFMTAPGSWVPITSGPYWELYVALGIIPRKWQPCAPNQLAEVRRIALLSEANDDAAVTLVTALSEDEAQRALERIAPAATA